MFGGATMDQDSREMLENLTKLPPVNPQKVPELGGGLKYTDEMMQRRKQPFQAKEEEFVMDKKNRALYHGDSYRLKQLFLNGMAIMSAPEEQKQPLNPLWMDLAKCATRIDEPAEMRARLEYYAHSDRVMVVRYFQDNCVACNAVEKTYEYICHEARRHLPHLDFYEIRKEESPELVKGLVRFPQVKGYSGGQWVDLDFKPPQEYRDSLYRSVGRQIEQMRADGEPITAVQAEEMYFSAAGPAMYLVLNGSINEFYAKAQARIHNYWKQVSVRRTWFYRTFVEPRVPKEQTDAFRASSVMGEKVVMGPELPTGWDVDKIVLQGR